MSKNRSLLLETLQSTMVQTGSDLKKKKKSINRVHLKTKVVLKNRGGHALISHGYMLEWN